MAVLYWSIPLFVLAVAIGTVPVLYGTLKQERWEEAEYATYAQREAAALVETVPVPVVAEASAARRLQLAHDEATVLLARLEELREIVAAHEATELVVAH
ncbi:MAG: hypothetical protein ABSB54_08225 [Acidimicrobiales bacterium]|jgi:hypothetical protein